MNEDLDLTTISITSLNDKIEKLSTIDLSTIGSVYSLSGMNGQSASDWLTTNIGAQGIAPNTVWTTQQAIPMTVNKSGKIELQGDDADIEINGKSLMSALAALEQRLNILTPNPELEGEWEDLKALGDQYRELEQRIKDKMATWDRLNAMPPPVVP